MPVYIVTGKLGGGKTLSMVGRIRDYLEDGRPVATNIDLELGHLVPHVSRPICYRVPDRPTVSDLEALGEVDTGGNEARNGALVLDECGTWLNSRTWSDKGRQAVIDWFLHSRKKGWDVFLIIQNISLLDKQVRDSMAEYLVVCRRLDRLNIPFVGRLVNAVTFGLVSGKLPHVHLAVVSYGVGVSATHADTWWYRGRDLWGAYSTRQVIADDSPGIHCLVKPPTPVELLELERKRRQAGKPKRPEVASVMALPADRRIPALRALGVV